MLSNMKSPSLYMQAAFRAQNPCDITRDGQRYRKENAYVFDFDPARTLIIFDDFANNLRADMATAARPPAARRTSAGCSTSSPSLPRTRRAAWWSSMPGRCSPSPAASSRKRWSAGASCATSCSRTSPTSSVLPAWCRASWRSSTKPKKSEAAAPRQRSTMPAR